MAETSQGDRFRWILRDQGTDSSFFFSFFLIASLPPLFLNTYHDYAVTTGMSEDALDGIALSSSAIILDVPSGVHDVTTVALVGEIKIEWSRVPSMIASLRGVHRRPWTITPHPMVARFPPQ